MRNRLRNVRFNEKQKEPKRRKKQSKIDIQKFSEENDSDLSTMIEYNADGFSSDEATGYKKCNEYTL